MSQNTRPYNAVRWPRLSPTTSATVADEAGDAYGVDILLVSHDDPLLAAHDDRESSTVDLSANRAVVDVYLGVADRRKRKDASPESKESAPSIDAPVKRAGFFRRLLTPRRNTSDGMQRPFWRRWFYTLFFCFGMLFIWAPVLLYVVKAPPIFNSSWTIIIPGTQVGASVDLVNVGEAYTDVRTPYGGNSFSPGVNFKKIMSSYSVMTAAAERLDLTLDDYGKPKIQVTDQAATIDVMFSGDSAELAQKKSQALYDAFLAELDTLRKDEVNARRSGSNEQLEAYRVEADRAGQELAEFRDTSTVVSADQYRAMVGTASNLEESLGKARVGRDAITSRLGSMADTLGVDAYRAADVMLLRQDKLVQALSSEYAKLQGEFLELASVLGAKHPKVVHARAKSNTARFSMIERVRAVVGDVDESLLTTHLPDPVGDDGQLYKDIVTFEAEREALTREITSSEQLLAEMRGRIAVAGTDLDRLEELERVRSTATTILVSATSNLDLGRSNIYATYPLTQLLVEPTLPDRPKRLLKLLAILGGLIGSGLILISIIVVKYRDRWRRLILKRE